MPRDILFKEPDFVFSYRVIGVLVQDGKVLLQKPKGDDYSFPGGHAMALESSRDTLVREFWEETHAAVEVDRLMAVGEVFFPWGDRPCHQIGLYYYVHLKHKPGAAPCIPLEGSFLGYDEWDNRRCDLDFVWVPLEQLPQLTVYPPQLVPHILRDDGSVLHFEYRE